MKVVKQSEYLRQQYDDNAFNANGLRIVTPILILMSVASLCLAFTAAMMGVGRLFTEEANLFSWTAFLMIGASVMFMGGASFTNRKWREHRSVANRFAQGMNGEEALRKLLVEQIGLGDEWMLLRNVVLPDRKDDIDGVLLGPSGIYALEVKALTGRHRYAGNNWYKQGRFGWREFEIKQHPGKQAYGNAKRLEAYLQQHGIGGSVQARLVWAGTGWLNVQKGFTPVWFVGSVDRISAELKSAHLYNDAHLEKVRTLLTR